MLHFLIFIPILFNFVQLLLLCLFVDRYDRKPRFSLLIFYLKLMLHCNFDVFFFFTSLCENHEPIVLIFILLCFLIVPFVLSFHPIVSSLYPLFLQDSLRQNRMTRFVIQPKEDPHGHITMFIGNLKPGLSQRQYEKVLIDIIGRGR